MQILLYLCNTIRQRAPLKTTHLLTFEIIISGTSNYRSIIEAGDAVRQPSSHRLAKLIVENRVLGAATRRGFTEP